MADEDLSIDWTSWWSTLICFTTAGTFALYWTFQEVRKYNNGQIVLTHKSKVLKKDGNNNGANNDNDDTVYLDSKLYYLSLAIYGSSFLVCLCGAFLHFPETCDYGALVLRVFFTSWAFSKMLIVYFQIERYQLCFQSLQTSNNNNKCSSFCNWYILYKSYLVISSVTIIVLVMFLMSHDRGRSNNSCSIVLGDNMSAVYSLNVIICDWCILGIFLFKLCQLRKKLKQLDIESGVIKLHAIMKQLFLISFIMECTFLSVSLTYGFSVKGLTLSAIFLAVDIATNVKFISLLLEHNQAQYDKFYYYLSKICCCCCGVCDHLCGFGDDKEKAVAEMQANSVKSGTVSPKTHTESTINDDYNDASSYNGVASQNGMATNGASEMSHL